MYETGVHRAFEVMARTEQGYEGWSNDVGKPVTAGTVA
jgi:hypothetical protein